MTTKERDEALAQLDLCFVIDCTTSMAPFIQAAQRQAQHILETLAAQANADMNVAVVGYRDHGHEPVCDVVPFASATKSKIKARSNAVTRALKTLKAGANNNPDAAEAVFDGLVEACGLAWRRSALRALVLVGDAPPHGCGADQPPWPDRFKRCPTGQTTKSMGAFLEEAGIALYALGMIPSSLTMYDAITEKAFEALAQSTGGIYRSARNAEGAIEVLDAIARRTFGDLELDRRIAIAIEDGELVVPPGEAAPGAAPLAPAPAAAKAAAKAGVSLDDVQASVARLKRRKIVD